MRLASSRGIATFVLVAALFAASFSVVLSSGTGAEDLPAPDLDAETPSTLNTVEEPQSSSSLSSTEEIPPIPVAVVPKVENQPIPVQVEAPGADEDVQDITTPPPPSAPSKVTDIFGSDHDTPDPNTPVTTAPVVQTPEELPFPTHESATESLSLIKLRVYNMAVFPGRFVIRLADSSRTSPESFRAAAPTSIDRVYTLSGFSGFAGRFTNAQLRVFDSNPAVADIFPDYVFQTASRTPPPPSRSTVNTASNPLSVANLRRQRDPIFYGLNRISHRVSEGYKDFIFPRNAGRGVTVYVLDTGIQADLDEFEGRVIGGVSTLPPPDNPMFPDVNFDNPFVDVNGHGTHVAGLVGSKTYGAAKLVKLVAVKVLYSFDAGTISSILGGVQYVEQQCRTSDEPCIMNMSLTASGRFDAFDEVIKRIKVPIFTAAGNGATIPSVGFFPLEACTVTPAGSPGAFAVGATDVRDSGAFFSNYGNCVQLYAPGVGALSVDSQVPSVPRSLDGTSQASGLVAGIAAIYLAFCPTLTKYELYAALIRYSTRGKVDIVRPGTPNRIAYIFPGRDLIDRCRKRTGFDFPTFSGMLATGPTGVQI